MSVGRRRQVHVRISLLRLYVKFKGAFLKYSGIVLEYANYNSIGLNLIKYDANMDITHEHMIIANIYQSDKSYNTFVHSLSKLTLI